MPKPQAMSMLARKVKRIYRLYALKDPFLLTARQWVRDRGDETLRFDYPLDQSSIVLDVGGYLGDFAEEMHRRFGCRVYLFEPVTSFYRHCQARFSNNPAISCFNFALSAHSGFSEIYLDDDATGFQPKDGLITQQVQVRRITEVVAELGLEHLDLVKLNIEGGEYSLLPAMIESGMIQNVRYLQVQFHNFSKDAAEKRTTIRDSLSNSHRPMWNYEFVWESWGILPRSHPVSGGPRP